MQKIELKCSNCGGQLNPIETQTGVYICLHCGNKEIITKEVPSSSYYINQNITKNIYGNEQHSDDEYFKLIHTAEKFLQINEHKKALKLLKTAINIDQSNYLAWWLTAKTKLLHNIYNKENNKLFVNYTLNCIKKDFKIAENFTINDEQKSVISNEFKELCDKYYNLCNISYSSDSDNPNDINARIKSLQCCLPIPFIFGLILLLIFFANMLPLQTTIAIPAIVFIFGTIIVIALLFHYKQYKIIIDYISARSNVSISNLQTYCKSKKINLSEQDLIDTVEDIINANYLQNYKISENKILKFD